ncbi:MAG: Holliday junction resolvase RuvX [Phycisphaerales bacterium]|nr:Holliday junction resolvase RuvX [Phycisphaerales bacterium]
MRYLCIDLGDKRTGLAVGDNMLRLASPVEVLEIPRDRDRGRALMAALAHAIDEHLGPNDQLVIGLPLNMDGTEGPRAKLVREFGLALADLARRRLHFHDERLSSVQADWDMGQTGMTHKQKKQKRDALAAAAILRDFLNSQSSPSESPPA